jgi:hypothetical protein
MEVWKDVNGFEGLYQVSNLGRVKSLERFVVNWAGTNSLRKQKFLSIRKSKLGYLDVKLCKDSIKYPLRVHRLVAMAFIPNTDKKTQVNHINGIKTDNRVENLEWVTGSENKIHAFRTGLQKPNFGTIAGAKKLTESDVIRIRSGEFGNLPQKEIAKIFSVSQITISRVLSKKRWPHI